jgi:hypothetical protein
MNTLIFECVEQRAEDAQSAYEHPRTPDRVAGHVLLFSHSHTGVMLTDRGGRHRRRRCLGATQFRSGRTETFTCPLSTIPKGLKRKEKTQHVFHADCQNEAYYI